jgi:hypothetical protein
MAIRIVDKKLNYIQVSALTNIQAKYRYSTKIIILSKNLQQNYSINDAFHSHYIVQSII